LPPNKSRNRPSMLRAASNAQLLREYAIHQLLVIVFVWPKWCMPATVTTVPAPDRALPDTQPAFANSASLAIKLIVLILHTNRSTYRQHLRLVVGRLSCFALVLISRHRWRTPIRSSLLSLLSFYDCSYPVQLATAA